MALYLIIGQGAAGVAAAHRLRELEPDADVTMATEEVDYFYSRVDLPAVVAGKLPPQATELHSAADFAARGINCQMGQTVVGLDREERVAELASGSQLHYDQLLLATGSHPVKPRIPGAWARGVHVIWRLDDAKRLAAAAETANTAVIIGAGLIGLKTALALQARGVHTTVVEQQTRVLPRQLDEAGSELVLGALKRAGLTVQLGSKVEEIVQTDGAVSAIRLQNGSLDCDLAVLAVGVAPNSSLADQAGLSVERGIVVDRQLRTSDPNIFAAGDVAVVTDRLTGQAVLPAIWPAAVEQGRLAAANMTGQHLSYPGSMSMNSVEIAGVSLVSLGDLSDEGDEAFTRRDHGHYQKLVVRDGLLRGAVLVGDISKAGILAGLIDRQVKVDIALLLRNRLGFADLLCSRR